MKFLTPLFVLFCTSLSAQLTFGPEQLIANPDGVVKVFSADFDNDGDLDLLSTATIDGISWWENDGEGNFVLGQYLQQTGDVPLCQSAAIADYDQDGDIDVMAFINTETSTSPTTFQYFINDGSGAFSSGFIVGDSGPNGQEVQAADFDSDGDMDVLFAEGSDDEIGWIENLSPGNWATPEVLTNQANGAQAVASFDVDGDGDNDIIAAGEYDDEWVWHENNGSQVLGSQQLIGTGDNVESIAFGDMDGDGLLDGLAVYAIDGDVVWAKNNGTGFDATQFVLNGNGFPDNFPLCVEVFDLDQDGDLDPVVCSLLNNTISWFANDGSGNFGPEQIIATNATNPRQVAFGDYDLDGDIDIAAQHFATDKLVWYENTSPVTIPGCTNAAACNYDENATTDDGSCDFSCLGCTDATACNFNETATIDDGSCEFIDAFEMSWNGDTTFCNGDGSEDLFAPGISNNGDSGQNQAFIITQNDVILYVGGTFSADFESYGAGTFEVYTISYNDNLTGLEVGLELAAIGSDCYDLSPAIQLVNEAAGCTDIAACNYDPAANCDDGSCIVAGSTEGCLDPLACNYDDQALTDNGTCYSAPEGFNCDGTCVDDNGNGICDVFELDGCTNPAAINYLEEATEDDGSCIFPSSYCGAGTVWNPGTQECISATDPDSCPGDFNLDGLINSTDLLQFLGLFNSFCP